MYENIFLFIFLLLCLTNFLIFIFNLFYTALLHLYYLFGTNTKFINVHTLYNFIDN
jgi:hypothetical protein